MFAARLRPGQRAVRQEPPRAGDGAPMRIAGLCVLLAVAGAGVAAWLALRAAAPPPPPASGAVEAAPVRPGAAATARAPHATTVASDVPGAEGPHPAPREAVAPPAVVATPAGDALLARAATDRELTLVTAEVLRVGAIARAETPDGPLEHQLVQLRVLADTPDAALRRWRVLDAPLCPSLSERLHGCHTPFDALAPGQVRAFVLAPGRPDLAMLGVLSAIAGRRERWLVLAGPEVERPDDPVLARVPAALQVHLGQPLINVFRGRVVTVVPARVPRRGGLEAAHYADVDVLDAAHLSVRGPLPKRVRVAPPPFTGAVDLASLEPGAEYWLATDDSGLWQTLRAAERVPR
jgi:hypothetical protein